jgi:hypothetical protein
VVAALAAVAEAGALLGGAVQLADEGVDVDHQPLAAGSDAGRPGAPDRLCPHPIKLAHVPEAERAQEGAQRRGRHHAVAKKRLGAAGPQHVAIVDRIGSKHHRVHERAELAARPRSAGPLAEVDRLLDEPLEASRLIRVLVNITPALATSRSSSNSTATDPGRTANPESFTIRVTS